MALDSLELELQTVVSCHVELNPSSGRTSPELLDTEPSLCFFKNSTTGAGEMAQRLRALPALPKVLSSIPSNHMVAHNHL
ncbi:hypothetical protein LEMLEM_LOCUS8868 [Lemmus lemmus]